MATKQSFINKVLSVGKKPDSPYWLPFFIGHPYGQDDRIIDLATLPNLMIVGKSGTGKTACLNSIIVSLLSLVETSYLKFAMIDPKMVELWHYEKLPESLFFRFEEESSPIITELGAAINALHALTKEIDRRVSLLRKADVKTLHQYNSKCKNNALRGEEANDVLPYIVVAIDEFADLALCYENKFFDPIFRLATIGQMVGIHLILTTQRPSQDVMSSRLKASFLHRLSFCSSLDFAVQSLCENESNSTIRLPNAILYSNGISTELFCGQFVDLAEIESTIEAINNLSNG